MTESLFLRTYRRAMGMVATGAGVLARVPGDGEGRRTLRARLGQLDEATLAVARSNPILWVHAASVGELTAVRPLLGRLRDRYPGRSCVVTTVTATGLELARQLPEVHLAFLFPIDAPRVIRRLLEQLRVEGVFFTETEIWPSFLLELERADVPAIMVSGRVSDRTLRRIRLLRPLYRRALARVVCCMQTVEDASRIVALGADPRLVHVAGSLKFDVPSAPLAPEVERLAAALHLDARRLIVAGSTHEGEEAAVFDAYHRVVGVHRDVTLLIAPRHPDRFPAVCELAARQGFPVRRYSEMISGAGGNSPSGPLVVILDAMGLLAQCYGLGVAAFVGGSLVPVGGHNVIEPARAGKPVIVGPHTDNIGPVVERLVTGGGAIRVASAELLAVALDLLLTEPARALEMGRRARELVQREQGSLERHAKIIAARLGTARFARGPADA